MSEILNLRSLTLSFNRYGKTFELNKTKVMGSCIGELKGKEVQVFEAIIHHFWKFTLEIKHHNKFEYRYK